MRVTLYFDEHVSSAIFKGLRRRGVDVRRVQDEGQRETADPLILDRALAEGWVVFTNDEDFLAEANFRQREGIPFTGVIFVNQNGLPIGKTIEDLWQLSQHADAEEWNSRVQYLPLRK